MIQFKSQILSIIFKNVYNTYFCRYSNIKVNDSIMKVLNVAEKNDAAKNIAGYLSGGNSQRVKVYNLYYCLIILFLMFNFTLVLERRFLKI